MDTTRYDIVGVCSGNIQRSPTFEVVFNHLLRTERPDLTDRVVITSAGANVDRYVANTELPARVIKILKAALKYEVVPGEFLSEVEKYVSMEGDVIGGDEAKLQFLHSVIRPRLTEINVEHRNNALQQRCIDPSGLVNLKPLGSDYNLVIAMDEVVAKTIQDHFPEITTYASFVGRDHVVEGLSGGLKTALAHVDYFLDTKDRFFEQLERRLGS
jgi:hypothetical protein